jgi:hypothetical protein
MAGRRRLRVLRASSVEEYARWYLRRERRKHPDQIADDSGDPVEVMRRDHRGKMRNWFSDATRWHIVSLDIVSDLASLVFLECAWTKLEGLVIPDGKNYRLLGRVAENATAGNYLARPSANKHKDYYDKLATGVLRIEGEDRVAICSAEESEIRTNPSAQYYLLDGLGRCLPYMILIAEHRREFAPIEAFCAAR